MKNIENKKLNIMFLIVFFALVGIYFLLQQPSNNPEIKIIKLSHLDQINKIEIIKNNIPVVLVKNNDTWSLRENEQDSEANADLVNAIIEALSSEMRLEKISDKVDKYSLYELDETQIVTLKIYKDEKLIKEFGIGKMGATYPSSFIRLVGNQNIYQVNNFLTFAVRSEDWLKPIESEEDSKGLSDDAGHGQEN
jgi:hypothetical protein